MRRKINRDGLALIKQWEGLRLDAYQDTGGVWTIGYGHTATARPGMRITETQADVLLRKDLAAAEAAVDDLVEVELSDGQFGALVSFVFNVGRAAFAGSTLLKRLNAGDYDAVPAQLARWNKDNGKVVPGLTNRRAAEAGLWAKGAFVASNTVPAAPARSITPAAAAAGGVAATTVVGTVVQAAPALSALQGLDWRVALAVLCLLAIGAAVWIWRR